MHLVFERRGYLTPTSKFPRELETENNTSDQQLLRRFVDEHSHLIHIDIVHLIVKNKHVLQYFIPRWLHHFFFDPHRCQNLYSTSLVISKCQWAIRASIMPNSGPDPTWFFIARDQYSNASHLLEYVKNGPDSGDLLLFLRYLSEIQWFDIYTQGGPQRRLTHGIIYWVCTTLVS